MNLRVFGARRRDRRMPGLVDGRSTAAFHDIPTVRAWFLILLEGVVGPVFGCLAVVVRPPGPLWPGFFGVDIERPA